MTERSVIVSTTGLSAVCAPQSWSADRSEAIVRLLDTLYTFPAENIIDVDGKSVANMLNRAGHG